MDKAPDAFRTISEVADFLDTPAHVLRFWESRFPQIRPVKRAGGRRYYRPSDVALLAGIKRLLHEDGLTIRGVQKVLRDQGVRHVQALSGETLPEAPEPAGAAAFAVALPMPETAEIIQLSAMGPSARPGAAGSPAQPAGAVEAGTGDVTGDETVAEALADTGDEPGFETGDMAVDEAAGGTGGDIAGETGDESGDAVAAATGAAAPEGGEAEAPGTAADAVGAAAPADEPEPAGQPFTTPRPTPAPPLPELPLFVARAPRESPATLAALHARLSALPPGALVHRRGAVSVQAQRLRALLPTGPV